MAVEDELTQKEHVVRDDGVDDASLPFQRQHRDVQRASIHEFQDEANDIPLLDVDSRHRHFDWFNFNQRRENGYSVWF